MVKPFPGKQITSVFGTISKAFKSICMQWLCDKTKQYSRHKHQWGWSDLYLCGDLLIIKLMFSWEGYKVFFKKRLVLAGDSQLPASILDWDASAVLNICWPSCITSWENKLHWKVFKEEENCLVKVCVNRWVTRCVYAFVQYEQVRIPFVAAGEAVYHVFLTDDDDDDD